MKSFFKKYFDLSKNENIVYLSAVSVFLPYYIAAALLLYIVGYILVKKSLKRDVFCHTGSFLLPVFCGITIITALFYKNYFGIFASVVVFLIFILGLYIRTVMTEEIFEKMLSVCCASSVVTSAIIILEKILAVLVFSAPNRRCFGNFFGNKLLSFYFNPNYLASIMAAVVIMCAYKVILRKGDMKYYYLTAVLAMITIYFGGSMFAWIEVVFALAVFLISGHHRKYLGVFFAICGIAAFAIYFVPDLLPRLSVSSKALNDRIEIWTLSIAKIPESWEFGRGFYSYRLVSYDPMFKGMPEIYPAYHAHNLLLEFLLSFGVVGSVVIGAFFFILFQKVFICKRIFKKSFISTMIIAVTAGILVHSLTDMTMFWIQTMVLYCLIFGGIGANEKAISNIFQKRKNNRPSEV